MAGRLTGIAAGGPRRHRAALATLGAAVLALHWGALHDLGDRLGALAPAPAMPPRIVVAYVRELAPAPPPAVAPAVVASPAAPRRRAAPRAAAPAASTPTLPPQPVAADTVAASVAEPVPAVDVLPLDTPPQPAAPAPDGATSAAVEPATGPASSPGPPAAVAAASAPAFSWPGSTRLSYRLTGNVRGEVHGSAQVEWVRVGNRYQVHLDVTVGLPIAPFITRRMSSDGELTDAGLAPQRYDEDTKLMFRDRRRISVLLDRDWVTLAGGERRPRPPAVQDSASQFVQLAWLFTLRPHLLHPGSVVEMPLALPRHVSSWAYEVMGEEPVYTVFGELPTYHLQPRRVARDGDLSAEVWIAPTLRYLPVRIRIRQDEATYIDMLISRRPELADTELEPEPRR